jgi:hypothetical protein
VSAALALGSAAPASGAPPAAPPCHSPLNPAYETLCYTTKAASGNVSVRVVGAGVDGWLVTGMSAPTVFAEGSAASATPVFEYFLSDNDEFVKIPLTVPLIFRTDPAGTWLASFFFAANLKVRIEGRGAWYRARYGRALRGVRARQRRGRGRWAHAGRVHPK